MGIGDLAPRDYVYCLDLDFNFDAQLTAIHGLLRRNRQADEALDEEIQEIDKHAQTVSELLGKFQTVELLKLDRLS